MTPEEEKKRKREEQLEKGRLRMKKNRAGTPKAPHELAVPSFLRASYSVEARDQAPVAPLSAYTSTSKPRMRN